MKSDPLRTLNRSSLSLPEDRLRAAADFRMLTVSLLAAAIGMAAGFVAYFLYLLIGLISNLSFFGRIATGLVPPHLADLGASAIIVPVAGALVIGLMVKYGSRRIAGHGIPEAMEAVLTQRSRIEPKVAVLKPLSAAIAIGTGGPFGAEGPIIQTGGAVGSLVGQVLHTTAAERKVLLACGAAGGMAATFSTPIAGIILAIELLLFEFKSRSFIPLVIASTLATAVHFQLLGRGPMFDVGRIDYSIPAGLPFYLIFGVIAGLAAVGFTRALFFVEDQFERLPVAEQWWPAIGALALGLIGLAVPRVFGVGYDVISDILNNRLVLSTLILVGLAKSAGLIIYLGSGTSGGLLAPMFIGGASLGAVFAIGANAIIPAAGLDPAAFGLVGMAAMFGAASRATFTFIIFAFEITRDYDAVLPLMLVSVIADGVALVFLRNSIMTEKLARRGLRVPTDFEADVLQHVAVEQVMMTEIPTIDAGTSVKELADRIARGDAALLDRPVLPVVDDEGRLIGVVSRGDVLRAVEEGHADQFTVLQAGTDTPVVTYPDETLSAALFKMLRRDIGRLPVVRRDGSGELVGWLTRAEVLRARLRKLEEEHVRERGWVGRLRPPV